MYISLLTPENNTLVMVNLETEVLFWFMANPQDTWKHVSRCMDSSQKKNAKYNTLQAIPSQTGWAVKIFTSSITSVIAECLGTVLYTPSLSDLLWRLGSDLCRAVVTMVSTGSLTGGLSGHCTCGCWLAEQPHRQSIHRQDGLLTYSLYSLCLGSDCQVIPVVQQRISRSLCMLHKPAKLMKTSGRLPHLSLSAWMKFPEGEKLRHHCVSLFFQFLKTFQSRSQSSFNGDHTLLKCWSEHLAHPHKFT